MSSALTAFAVMMTLRRRSDDSEQDTAVGRYAKQVAPMVVVALLTGAGVQLGPLGQNVSDGRDEIKSIVVAIGRIEERMEAQDRRVTEITARSAAQMEDLEKRMRVCELNQAGAKR